MGDALSELIRRKAIGEEDRVLFARSGRHIEAAACEVRVQVFREAVAVLKGNPLPPNRMHQSNNVRSAEAKGGLDA